LTSRARRRDWEILGLEPGSDLGKVKRAHHYRRSLYDPGSLATYTLLDEDERTKMLSRIDEAYWRIVGIEPSPSRIDMSDRAQLADETEIPSGPAPDAATEPGAHLRHHRLSLGLSLQQVAAETKVGARILESVENEDFAALPAAVFVRGYILQLARVVKAPAVDELATLYLAKMRAEKDDA
jgi:hypothetical protein